MTYILQSIICCLDAKTTKPQHGKVINLGIPHIGEQVLENIDTDELIKCLKVSETWKILAENVLFKRWKGHIFEACEGGKVEIVKIISI